LVGCATTAPVSWPEPPTSRPLLAAEESETPVVQERKKREDYTHAMGLFLGGAFRRGDGGSFAVGVDYEYILNERWGIGAFADFNMGRSKAVVVGAAGYYKPMERLALVVGPGVEFEDHDSEFLVRLGGLYEFLLGDMVVSPTVYVDLINDNEPDLLLGLTFAWGF
jgi:hypothetical protein